MRRRPRGIIVAIDGPAASGKSTTATAVAGSLAYAHLNSGQLYRAITWAALRGGWMDATPETFLRRLGGLDLELVARTPDYRVLVDGSDPGPGLLAPETVEWVSRVAAMAPVRARVLELLRSEGDEGGVVCDGRDIGTVVFPDAELKVFLVASAAERGRRRLLDHGIEPTPERVEVEAHLLAARDDADSTRELSPLVRAADALEIDTTGQPFSDVVDRIVQLAREAGARSCPKVDDLSGDA